MSIPAGHGIPSNGKFSHTCFAIAGERQALVLGGIQVILLVRLMALVSNRPSALGLPSVKYTRSFFMGAGVPPAHELLLANSLKSFKQLGGVIEPGLNVWFEQEGPHPAIASSELQTAGNGPNRAQGM